MNRSILSFVAPLALAACAEPPDARPDSRTDTASAASAARSLAGYTACESDEIVQRLVEEALPGGLGGQTMRLDGETFARAAETGEPVTLPALDARGEITEIAVIPAPVSVYAEGARAYSKDPDGREEAFEVDTSATFQLACEDGATCGAITFLDGAPGVGEQYEGMIVHDQLGWIFLESASSLLLNATGSNPGLREPCGVVYSGDDQLAMQFNDDPEEPYEGDDNDYEPKPQEKEPFAATIPIILDADQKFYGLDTATVWTRQASIINGVNAIYGVIEPATSGVFDITFQIESQETWVYGGPTTTNDVKLTDEVNDPGYFMINHPGKDDLSYFFVGYDLVSGVAGRAGSICNYPGYDDGLGSGLAHPRNHAIGQQVEDKDGGYQFSTFYGRLVVAAHEIGHMVGGTHGDGKVYDCAGGGLPNLCGCTLMRSGASGGVAPDFRKPFFSAANDENIKDCVDDVY